MDADYCAQIIKVVHSLGTPGFSTLNTYDKVSDAQPGLQTLLSSSLGAQ